MKEEKEAKTNRKKLLTCVLLAAGVLLLAAAIVLTVYFTTNVPGEIAEVPGGETPGGETPDKDDGETPGGDEDDTPTGGETERYAMPVASADCTTEHDAIYANAAVGMYYRHSGVDFAAEAGAEVYAMADGVVSEISLSEQLGNLVTIEHDGGLETVYRFVEPVDTLDVGDTVDKGELIGYVAEAYGTESQDGTHLHFEVLLNGEQTDPAGYLDLVYEEK